MESIYPTILLSSNAYFFYILSSNKKLKPKNLKLYIIKININIKEILNQFIIHNNI